MQLIMSNPTEREMIRMRQDAHRDEITSLAEAERTGEERGKREAAKRMKEDGMDYALIVKYTGLSVEDIEKL